VLAIKLNARDMKKFLTLTIVSAALTMMAAPKWPNIPDEKWPHPSSDEQNVTNGSVPSQAWPGNVAKWPCR